MSDTADGISRLCGAAAILGGVMWAAKGSAILATGDQPPLLFEVPLALFPIGLLGLRRRLGDSGGRGVRPGAAAAWLALTAALLTGAVLVALGDDAPDALVGSCIAVAALGIVAGLVLLGTAAKTAHLFSRRGRWLPLVLGLATVPAVTVIGGLLEAIHERLLELPLVILALGWILLGAAIAVAPGRSPSPHRSPSS